MLVSVEDVGYVGTDTLVVHSKSQAYIHISATILYKLHAHYLADT